MPPQIQMPPKTPPATDPGALMAFSRPPVAPAVPAAPAPVVVQIPKLHDVTVKMRKTVGQAKIMGVPPEEFGISRRARCIRDSDYCYHATPRPQHELIACGYDPEQIKALPTYGTPENSERLARSSVNEDTLASGADTLNQSARLVEVTEHYIRLDYEGDGVARLYKVVTGGHQGDILRVSHDDGPYEDDIEEVDIQPFATMTPIMIPHRVIGRSVADLVMDIQKIKTALLRAMLDNAYLSNNPRPEVADQGMTDNTLDDLLTWRPGAPIRVKTPGTVVWQEIPSIAAQVFPLMEYLDATREWRTGVSKQGQGLDANVLQNQTATAVNQLFTAAQARMKLIARIFAETGIRDLFLLLHQTIRKNDTIRNTVRLRNQWVPVDPRQWKTRTDMTVNVGLGSGGKEQQITGLALIGQAQEKMAIAPQLNLVGREELYETGKELTKLLGYRNPERFFKDPAKNQPGQMPPDPKMELERFKAQAQIDRERAQAQADVVTQQQKAQSEAALADKRFALERELKLTEMNANIAEKQQMAQHKMAMEAQRHQQAMQKGAMMEPDAMAMAVQKLAETMSRPRKIRRGKDGRVEGLE